MNLPLVIALNAVLDLALVLAVLAVVRFAHRLHDEARPETVHPSQPIPLHIALPAHGLDELARAA